MKSTKNMHILVCILIVVSVFSVITGCTININFGNSSDDALSQTEGKTGFDYNVNDGRTMYESRAMIYISNSSSADSTLITSSDLTVSKQLIETYTVILDTKKIQSKIQEAYPNVKYKLTLKPANETEIIAIIATGENPEKLADVCNLAVSLMCEEVPHIVEGSFCKVVDYAKPAQPIRNQ